MKSTNLDLERVLSPEPIIANVPPTVIIIIAILIISLDLVDQNTYQVLHLIKDKMIKSKMIKNVSKI